MLPSFSLYIVKLVFVGINIYKLFPFEQVSLLQQQTNSIDEFPKAACSNPFGCPNFGKFLLDLERFLKAQFTLLDR